MTPRESASSRALPLLAALVWCCSSPAALPGDASLASPGPTDAHGADARVPEDVGPTLNADSGVARGDAAAAAPPDASTGPGSMGCGATSAPPVRPTSALSAGTAALRTDRPRLWWTPERLARARAWAAARGGFRPEDEPTALALAYVLGGDRAFARRAIDHVLAMAWDPDRPGDEARWEGEGAALVYDWCHDAMTDAERALLRGRFDGWITAFNTHEWGGIGMPGNNYYWGFLRNSLLWGIATRGESIGAEALIDHALSARFRADVLPFLDGPARGGIPIEGSMYGRYMLQYPIVAFTTVDLAGRRILDETQWYREAVYYVLYATAPAPREGGLFDVFPWGEDSIWQQGGSANVGYGDFMTMAANAWPDDAVGRHARAWLDRVGPDRSPHVEAVDPGGPSAPLEALPLDYFAPGPGFLFARSAWQPSATALFFKADSPGYGHEQLDAGAFKLVRGRQWLSRGAHGYSGHDRYRLEGYGGGLVEPTDTIGQNALYIGGRGLATGGRGAGRVIRLEHHDAFVYVAADLTAAYQTSDEWRPDRGNPSVRSVVRELLFVRALETLVVLDRVETTAEGTPKTFLVHFEAPPQLEAGSARFRADGSELEVTTLRPLGTTRRLVAEGGLSAQTRLEIESRGPADEQLLHVLSARDAGAAPVVATVDEDARGLRVTLSDGSRGPVSVTFGPSRESVPSIALPGCSARPLAGHVQSIAVAPDGPRWGG